MCFCVTVAFNQKMVMNDNQMIFRIKTFFYDFISMKSIFTFLCASVFTRFAFSQSQRRGLHVLKNENFTISRCNIRIKKTCEYEFMEYVEHANSQNIYINVQSFDRIFSLFFVSLKKMATLQKTNIIKRVFHKNKLPNFFQFKIISYTRF